MVSSCFFWCNPLKYYDLLLVGLLLLQVLCLMFIYLLSATLLVSVIESHPCYILFPVCTTTLKRICRQHGIKRWPSRKIKKVGHSLQKLQLVIDSVHQGASSAFQIDSFYSKFPELASPKLPVSSSLFSTWKQIDNNNNPNPSSTCLQSPEAPSSSCSQSSSSSHSCSNTPEQHHQHQHYNTQSVDGIKDHHHASVGEDCENGVLKRITSEVELKIFSQDRSELNLRRCQSHETLGQLPKTALKGSSGTHKTPDQAQSQRVKVTFGEEKARFRMPDTWGYQHLLREIATRFNIDDMSKYDLKYLDDDSEWVLLTCDADLEECIDVCQSSQSSTIKLCLQVSRTLGLHDCKS